MKTVIEMARESNLLDSRDDWGSVPIEYEVAINAFAELVRADEREKYKWDVHSCGPTCKRYACVSMREAVEAEREACAKVCDDLPAPDSCSGSESSLWDVATLECGDAIRARSNT